MMKTPRGLSADEATLWARVAQTVKPLHLQPPARSVGEERARGVAGSTPPDVLKKASRTVVKPSPLLRTTTPPDQEVRAGLDASWERKLARAAVAPDFTLDLHGHTLDQARQRLDAGLGQAKGMGARLVLLITGKPRPAEAADRGATRGAIRAKVLDWLAAGPHAKDIAAIRKAHRRHGGEGALYLILKRPR